MKGTVAMAKSTLADRSVRGWINGRWKGAEAGEGEGAGFRSYFFAVANRLFTSAQFTTFHHAAR
jgi:hypothetical protein